MTPPTLQANKAFVLQHFEDFVNRKDLSAIDRNMAADFYDHDGPGGKPTDSSGDKQMMAAAHRRFPDLHVTIEDIIAADDKVVCRNTWRGTDHTTGKRIVFKGIVIWRIADGKLAERWATVEPPHEQS